MAWTYTLIMILFLRFIWAGIRDVFLTAIRAVGGVAVFLSANHEDGGRKEDQQEKAY